MLDTGLIGKEGNVDLKSVYNKNNYCDHLNSFFSLKTTVAHVARFEFCSAVTYSSLRAQRLWVRAPCFLRVSLSSR